MSGINMMLIMFGIVAVAVLAIFIICTLFSAKVREQKETIDDLEEKLLAEMKESEALRETVLILKANREEADEKIKALHDGDSVVNAADILHK